MLSLAVLNPSLFPEHVTRSAHVQHDQKVRLSVFCRDLKSKSTEVAKGLPTAFQAIPVSQADLALLHTGGWRAPCLGAQNVTQEVSSRERDPTLFPELIHSAGYDELSKDTWDLRHFNSVHLLEIWDCV